MVSSSTNSNLKIIINKEEELREKKTSVAILFVDMSGSTAYKDQKGSEKGLIHTVQHNLLITNIINKLIDSAISSNKISEGEICKYIGDEVMAFFKGKDAAQIATEISIEIQKTIKKINKKIDDPTEKFHCKIGIDFGSVYFYEYSPKILDPQGLTVDRAARIISLSKSDQIIVSDSVNKKVRKYIKYGPQTKRKLKGIKRQVSVYEVLWDNDELGISQTDKEYTLPQLLKFHSSDRKYKLDRNGNATITWKALIENTSEKSLRQFKIPVSFDIYDKPSPSEFIQIKKIKIGDKLINNPNDYFETKGVLTSLQNDRRAIGATKIPFNKVGNLEKNKPVLVEICYKLIGAFAQ